MLTTLLDNSTKSLHSYKHLQTDTFDAAACGVHMAYTWQQCQCVMRSGLDVPDHCSTYTLQIRQEGHTCLVVWRIRHMAILACDL